MDSTARGRGRRRKCFSVLPERFLKETFSRNIIKPEVFSLYSFA